MHFWQTIKERSLSILKKGDRNLGSSSVAFDWAIAMVELLLGFVSLSNLKCLNYTKLS
jgi:hypothetical protein